MTKFLPTDQKRFVKLGWTILECKCIYYALNGDHPRAINDYDYDMMEKEYEALAIRLGEEATACNMIDFDMSRPACQQVYNKLTSTLPDHLRSFQAQETLDKFNKVSAYEEDVDLYPPDYVKEIKSSDDGFAVLVEN